MCVLKLDLERLAQLLLFVADDFAEAHRRYRRQSVEQTLSEVAALVALVAAATAWPAAQTPSGEEAALLMPRFGQCH